MKVHCEKRMCPTTEWAAFFQSRYRILGLAVSPKTSDPTKTAECRLALRHKSEAIGLCRRLPLLGICVGLRLVISFRSNFLCDCLLEFFSIHSIAFGGVHKNVVAAGGSLIR